MESNERNQIQVELQDWMGNDKAIAEAAWTSSTTLENKDKKTPEDVARIVKMLAEQGHSTPFESVIFRFWIKMPIVTDRQHMTHRIASHNGMSGRYRTMPEEFLQIPEDIKNILTKIDDVIRMNKGSSGGFSEWISKEYVSLCEKSNKFYRDALSTLKYFEAANEIENSEYKRVREFIRGALPQNNMTERVTIMNLRSFANYQKLRNSPHAQPEIQRVARLMLEAVEKANICPIALQALKDNGWKI